MRGGHPAYVATALGMAGFRSKKVQETVVKLLREERGQAAIREQELQEAHHKAHHEEDVLKKCDLPGS